MWVCSDTGFFNYNIVLVTVTSLASRGSIFEKLKMNSRLKYKLNFLKTLTGPMSNLLKIETPNGSLVI